MRYVTLTQVKQALSITGTDRDDYLLATIDRVSAWIDSYTGRTFSTSAQSVENELHEQYRQVLWLNEPDIANVASIQVKDQRSDDWTTLDTDDYDWRSYGRICLDMPYRFVQVSYTHGGSGVPKDIEAAALQMVMDAYNAVSPPDQVTSESIGDYSVTYANRQSLAKAASATVTSVLDNYKVIPV